MALRLLTSVLSAAIVVDGFKMDVTPIEKVTSLLKGLQAKVTKEGESEAAEYDKFACFCKEQVTGKQYAIEKSTAKIADLKEKIKLGQATVTKLSGQVADLTTEISKRDKEIASDAAKRAKAHKAYLAKAQDIAESIDGTAGAIEAFKDAKGDMQGDVKVNLLEVHRKLVASAHRVFGPSTGLIEEADLEEDEQSPAGFQFQGNGIIGSLEKLLANFKKLKATVDMDETDNQALFDKKALGDKNENQFANEDKDEKNKLAAAEQESVASLTDNKDEETKDMNSDQAFLKTLTADCENKAKVFDQRSKSRSDELTAMNGAIAELDGGVAANEDANSKLVGLVQGDLAPSFIQRYTLQEKGNRAVRRVQELLQEAATDQGSSALKSAAVRVMLAKDHFDKVRGLIKDMVKKLEETAAAEATQKGRCDKEMGKAMTNRDKGQARVEVASSEIAKLNSLQQDLTEDIADLDAGIASNNKALNEATELRKEEKASNEQTIADGKEGKQATQNALSLLSTFYAKAAKASFVQLRSKKYVPPNADRDGKNLADLAPSSQSANYKGSQEESKGIMGMLDVIVSDFDRTVRTVTKEEKANAADFAAFDKDTTADTNTKKATKKKKEQALATAESDENDQADEKEDATQLLDTAKDSLDNLKAQCVEGEETWEERVAARKQEIESLKDAMKVLEEMQD